MKNERKFQIMVLGHLSVNLTLGFMKTSFHISLVDLAEHDSESDRSLPMRHLYHGLLIERSTDILIRQDLIEKLTKRMKKRKKT